MKRLYTLILAAMAVASAAAADWTYMPMVREGVEWHYATKNVREGETDMGDIYMRFDGTESIDGKTYSVLYRYDSPDFDKTKAQTAAYMREDGHRVYAICLIEPDGTAADGKEQLAYDFDTPENNIFAAVEKSGFVSVEGAVHKALYDRSLDRVWAIDGIGIATDSFLSDGYLPFPNPYVKASTFYFSTYLVDVKESATGRTIYDSGSFYGSVADDVCADSELVVAVAGGQLRAATAEGECCGIAVHNLVGATVASSSGASVVTDGLQSGVYVVTAVTPSGSRVAKKVIL